MRDLDAGVEMAHWTADAVVEAVAPLTGRIGAFARRHGLPRSAGVELAVSEVLTDAVRNQGGRLAMSRLHVDAAIDRSCLSVRIAGDAPERIEAGAAPLVLTPCLADRVEAGPGHGLGTSVLMEFLLPYGVRREARRTCEGRRHR